MPRKRQTQRSTKQGRKAGRKTTNVAKFRFLDLSAELRNQIYEIALTLNEDAECSTNLLLVCKQINQEATSYLYDNTVEIEFYAGSIDSWGEESAAVYVAGGQIEFEQPQCDINWPSFLRRICNLKFQACNNCNSVYEIEGVLYSLFSFLGSRHELHKLELDFPTDDYGFDRVPDIFSVRLLNRPDLELVIKGAHQPRPLVRDKETGIRRNAKNSHEACHLMYNTLQTFIPYTLEHANNEPAMYDENQFLIKLNFGSPGIVPTCEIYSKMKKSYLRHNRKQLLRFGSILRDWYLHWTWDRTMRDDRDEYGYLTSPELHDDFEQDIPTEWWKEARRLIRAAIELEVMVRIEEEATEWRKLQELHTQLV
jgi:hypothetical protein